MQHDGRTTVSPEPQPARGLLGGWRPGLRTRSMVAFAAVALVLSSGLALLSYEVTRSNLLEQRATAAERQAYLNGRLVRTVLRSDEADVPTLLSSLQLGREGAAVLRAAGEWYGTAVGLDRGDIPRPLADAVTEGQAGWQWTRVDDSGPFAVVGVPISAVDAMYFEFVSLAELEATLSTLAAVLAVAAVGTTTAGAVFGHYASGRVLRPLRRMARTASGIAGGALDHRLDAGGDPDLEPLVASFNAMVDALEARIEREAQFASDVSHELRAPLAAMSSALSVARRRSAGAADDALEVLGQKIEAFNQLVTDLLEISRLQAGVAVLSREAVNPEELVRGVCAAAGHDVPVKVEPGTPERVEVDPRRVGQMLTNLLENAALYAGGATGIELSGDAATFRIAVDDDGPGVPEHERAYIFERFARGEHSGQPGAPPGTGLGLSLVAEHARLHGGRVRVEDAPSGGARFVVELPVGQP